MGPMLKDILARYNDSSKNAFGIAGLHADEVVTSSILIGWLATLMKYILDFFYILIPNYGIAIILLTILTKVVFLPLTFKSSESMAKMATLNPKMTEIRARLKEERLMRHARTRTWAPGAADPIGSTARYRASFPES